MAYMRRKCNFTYTYVSSYSLNNTTTDGKKAVSLKFGSLTFKGGISPIKGGIAPRSLRMAPKQSKQAFPTPNDWSRLAPNLGRWSRPINISLPCIGIDGAGFALKAMKVPFTAINVYDLERRYNAHLSKHLGDSNLHLGEDFTKVTLEDLERPCDMVIVLPGQATGTTMDFTINGRRCSWQSSK